MININNNNVTVEERNDYGYTWDGMHPLSKEEAIELFNKGENVYLLYEDNTEGLAYSIEDIEGHIGGMFGIEEEDLKEIKE